MKYSVLLLATFLFSLGTMAQKTKKVILSTQPYPAVIAFHSFAAGTPSDVPLTNFIYSFKKKNNIKKITALKISPLGKEGEYNLCFTLTELTISQKRNFMTQVQTVLKTMTDRGNATLETEQTYKKADLPANVKLTYKVY